MAINKNHEFEDLEGIKCSIVERDVLKPRVEFLKSLLEYNRYKVIVIPSPPAKAAPIPKPVVATPPVTGNSEVAPGLSQPVLPETAPSPPPPETFTLGVTDVMFNATNAIFGRLLHTADGHVVTLAYWEQKENVAHDEIPYFENTK